MMKRLDSGYVRILTGAVVLALLLWAMNSTLNSYYLRIINVMGINMILAMSLNLTNGFCGVFSLGHAAFMAIGAYVSSLFTLDPAKKASIFDALPLWMVDLQASFFPALVIGGLVAMFFAFLIGGALLKLRGHYLSLATLGFVVIINGLLVNLDKYTNGTRGINAIPPYSNIWWIFGSVFLVFLILWRFTHSHFGRSLKAIREDQMAAESFGINPFRYKLLSFCIGAFFAAYAGGLYAHMITAITPSSFYYAKTFSIVMMVIVGGSGSLTGSLVGAAIISILPELLRFLESGTTLLGMQIPALYGISNIVLSLLMIIVLIFYSGGIMGTKELRIPKLTGVKLGGGGKDAR